MLKQNIIFEKCPGSPRVEFCDSYFELKDKIYKYDKISKLHLSKSGLFHFNYDGKEKSFNVDKKYREQCQYIIKMIYEDFPNTIFTETDTKKYKRNTIISIICLVVILFAAGSFIFGDSMSDTDKKECDKYLQVQVDSISDNGNAILNDVKAYSEGKISSYKLYKKLDVSESYLFSLQDIIDNKFKEEGWSDNKYQEKVKSLASNYLSLTKEIKKYLDDPSNKQLSEISLDVETADYIQSEIEKERKKFLK